MTYLLSVSTDTLAPWLADLADAAPYLALMGVDPYSVVDPLTLELPDYTRPAVTWTLHDRFIQLAADAAFLNVPGHVAVVAFAGFDAPFNGTMGWALKITPFTTETFGSFRVDAADVQVGFGPP